MTTYGMIIDVERCNGCYSCFLSCKDEYCGNDYFPYSTSQPEAGQYWMNIQEIERGCYPKVKVSFLITPCMQCENPPCAKVALNNAVYRRDDGIIIIDPEKARGQKEIVDACPYRVIYWNEEKQIPQKCTFCAHGLDNGWRAPRCVEACPSEAIVFGDLDDPTSKISKLKNSQKAERLNSEYSGKPKVNYLNLPKRFIAGEIVLADNVQECAVGISVILKNGKVLSKIKTDSYGDFEFGDLEENKEYTVVIEHEGYASREYKTRTKIDINLGEILLEPNG